VRARASGRPLAAVLEEPGQFALCEASAPLARRLRGLAADILAGRVKPPPWARRAWSFVAPWRLDAVRARWERLGYRLIRGTGTVHFFFERVRVQRAPLLKRRAPKRPKS
jgi:hypothetical protein